jgi:hypothetical protein
MPRWRGALHELDDVDLTFRPAAMRAQLMFERVAPRPLLRRVARLAGVSTMPTARNIDLPAAKSPIGENGPSD